MLLYCYYCIRYDSSFLISTIYSLILLWFFFLKQKTAYEIRISAWSSDVCSSDLTYDVSRGGLRTRLIQILAAIATASVLTVGAASIAAFDRAVEPELANRTRLIGSIVRTELQRTLELGIPLEAIAGLDRYLAETLSKFQAVERIVVTTAAGEEVAVVEHPESERS